MTRNHAIILAGPTASGKSALALDIAQDFDVVIINADSKQVYREIPIITAQPSKAEQEQVPHMLYGVISAAEHCSTMRWARMAKEAIEQVLEQGKLPVLVGGTGMYIQTLVEGISPIPEIDTEIRREARQSLETLGNEAFYQELKILDPQMASRLSPGDSQRIVRAYEVMRQTGKSLAEWQKLPREAVCDTANFLTLFLNPVRESVYERCNQRFEHMVKAGVINEIKALDAMGLDEELPAMKAHGVPEMRACLAQKMTLEEAISQAQRNTRHYIKRQFTWFKHQVPGIAMIEGGSDAVAQTKEAVQRFLLT